MADKNATASAGKTANQLVGSAVGQTAHTAATMKLTGVFKYKLTFSNIKAFDLNSADFVGKNETYIRFKLDEEHIVETEIATDLKSPEWKADIVMEATLQQSLEIAAVDSDSTAKNILSDDVVGLNVFSFKDISVAGSSLKKFQLTKKGKPAGYITANLAVEINKDYEKQAGYKGIIIVSDIVGKITRDTQTFGDMDPLCVFTFDGQSKSTFRAVDGDKEPKWSESVIFGLKANATSLDVKLNNVDSKGTSELGSAAIDVKNLIQKHGIFKQEEVPLLFQAKPSGKLTMNLEYRPFELGESAKIYEARRNLGKVNLTALSAKLTRDTETVGKMDPYLVIKFNDIVQKTTVIDGAGKEPNWKENFSFDVFSYQKTKQLTLTVYDQDSNADDIVGEGVFDLEKYLATDKLDKPIVEEKVEIFFEKKSAGHVMFKVTSESNKVLKQLLADEEKAREQNRKKEEEERLQKEKAAADAKLEEEKKKQTDKDALDKANSDAKAKADADAKKKQQELEDQKRKDQEAQKKKQGQQEEEEMIRMKEEQQRLQQSQLQNDSKVNNSRFSGSQSLKKLDEYKIAMRNMKGGFGMSEFQSANTLQNSVVATSFSKERRFHALGAVEKQSGPSFIVLPSIFSNSKKGAGFGHGTRGGLTQSQNPGPGTYEVSNKLFQRNYSTFGESRSRCKNSIAVPKMSVEQSSPSLAQRYQQSLANSRTEVRLPLIKPRSNVGGSDIRLQMYPSHPSDKNYHFRSQAALD